MLFFSNQFNRIPFVYHQIKLKVIVKCVCKLRPYERPVNEIYGFCFSFGFNRMYGLKVSKVFLFLLLSPWLQNFWCQ